MGILKAEQEVRERQDDPELFVGTITSSHEFNYYFKDKKSYSSMSFHDRKQARSYAFFQTPRGEQKQFLALCKETWSNK